jgi:hypothetical protein
LDPPFRGSSILEFAPRSWPACFPRHDKTLSLYISSTI